MTPILTIFTAPKPFTHPHITLIQRNAIQSWLHLGEEVEVILIGEEAGLGEVVEEYRPTYGPRLKYLPQVKRNVSGTPLVSSIFDLARKNSQTPWLAYANADILLLPELVEVTRQVSGQVEQFLIVGQRWDLDLRQPLDFGPGWEERLRSQVQESGRLHPPGGSDYFIFPRQCFMEMPAFAIGRAGWDNWMFLHARQRHWALVDATQSLLVIHQEHDYSHLPGGQPHYQLPETSENIRLAGGRRAIFSLLDADHTLVAGQVQRIPRSGKKLLRELEIFPLVTLHSFVLGELFFALFHPLKAWSEWRGRLMYLAGKLRKSVS